MKQDTLDNDQAIQKKIEDVFSQKGPLAKNNEHYRSREGQLAFAKAVTEAILKEESLIAEAGTGTGKTYAYLVPALLSGAKVIISTAAKPLQDQLYFKDIPVLSKALGIQTSTALLKGRSNYVCLKRLEEAQRAEMLPERDSGKKLKYIVDFSKTTQSGDKALLREVSENDPLWPMVTSTRENCPNSADCPYFSSCFVKKARENAMKSNIVVVNHHLLLSSLAIKHENEGEVDGLLPEANLFVIDEAHQLPSIGTNFFGRAFSTYEIQRLADEFRQIGRSKLADGAEWDKIHAKAIIAISNWRAGFQGLGLKESDRKSVTKIDDLDSIADLYQALLEALKVMDSAFEANAERDIDFDLLRRRYDDLMIEMNHWVGIFMPKSLTQNTKKTNSVRWIEVLSSGLRFNDTPLNFGPAFKEMCDMEGGAWLYTSATLSAGAGERAYDHFKRALGLEEAKVFSTQSPFDYFRQGVFYLPKLPAPRNNTREHTINMLEAAWPLLLASKGRAFILCTTLYAVDIAHRWLEDKVAANARPFPVLSQGMNSRSYLIDQFRKLGNAVLIGSMSFWEGIDVQGEALSLVVIDKLPFAPPDDPVGEAKCEYIQAQGGKPFFDYTLPEAVISLRQGVGRLIRSEIDTGVLMFCDTRVWDKPYGREIVLKSMPDFYRTRHLKTATDFFTLSQDEFDSLYRYR